MFDWLTGFMPRDWEAGTRGPSNPAPASLDARRIGRADASNHETAYGPRGEHRGAPAGSSVALVSSRRIQSLLLHMTANPPSPGTGAKRR